VTDRKEWKQRYQHWNFCFHRLYRAHKRKHTKQRYKYWGVCFQRLHRAYQCQVSGYY